MATVNAVGGKESVRMPDGKWLRKWEVVVDDNGQEVSAELWTGDDDKFAPKEGETVELENKKGGGLKAKRPKRQQDSGGNRNGGGSKGWVPRLEDDPVVYAAKQAAIAAQTSLERAIDFMDRRGDLADKNVDDDVLINRLLVVAGKFEDHVSERAKAAGTRVREANKS